MKKVIVGLSLLIATASIISCEEKDNKYPGYSKVQEGLYIKMLNDNATGRVAVDQDILTVHMEYKTDKDSVLLNSAERGGPIQIQADSGLYVGDLMRAFIGLKEGDSASIIIKADSFFLKRAQHPTLPAFVDSSTVLYFTIGVVKVESLEEIKAEQAAQAAQAGQVEMAQLQAYLTENGIETAPNPSGLIVIPSKVGTGKQAVAGKKVLVNYAGRLLNGKYFDTSIEEVAREQGIFDERRMPYKAFDFILGQGQVIPGWDEGIATMKVGGKAQFIIPSSLAYGPGGAGGLIPPSATLIFDVELLDVLD